MHLLVANSLAGAGFKYICIFCEAGNQTLVIQYITDYWLYTDVMLSCMADALEQVVLSTVDRMVLTLKYSVKSPEVLLVGNMAPKNALFPLYDSPPMTSI